MNFKLMAEFLWLIHMIKDLEEKEVLEKRELSRLKIFNTTDSSSLS